MYYSPLIHNAPTPGATWANTTSPAGTYNWSSISSSQNGSVLLAADEGGQLWLSTDGGNTWMAQTSLDSSGGSGVGAWSDVAVSGDGTSLVALDCE